MRKKELTLIVTFPSTTHAMLLEMKCKELKLSGRIIPVPGEISAGCGLAWCTEPVYRDQIEKLIIEQKVQIEGITEIFF